LNALLSITNLAKRFGAVQALRGIDLEIGAGEMFVLLGGSGSGKTTLLRCIGGFEQPDAGRIALDGTDITALPAHRRPVNTMFQSYALFPHMTVAENIGFGPRQAGLPRAEIASRNSCCWTNRFPPSTPRCGRKPAPNSPPCNASSA